MCSLRPSSSRPWCQPQWRQLTASDVGLKYRWHGHVNPVSGDRAVALTSGSRIERQRAQPSETTTTGPRRLGLLAHGGSTWRRKAIQANNIGSDVTNKGVGKCRARAAEVLGHNGCDRQCPCHWQVHHDSAQVGESVGCADGQHGGSELVADELPTRRGRRPERREGKPGNQAQLM